MEKILKLTSTFKQLPIPVTEVEVEEPDIIIEGYANTSTIDRVGDIIVPEAWKMGGLDNYRKKS